MIGLKIPVIFLLNMPTELAVLLCTTTVIGLQNRLNAAPVRHLHSPGENGEWSVHLGSMDGSGVILLSARVLTTSLLLLFYT